MQTKTVLIHHHIFKNAGTSFNNALKQYFKNDFWEFDLPNSKLVTNHHINQFILNHPKALAISSHHACMPTPQTQQYRTISSVLLRQPLARIESIYKFERQQQADTQGAIKAKELSFVEYVLWRLEKTPNIYRNYQTHYCSRSQQSQHNQIPNEENLEIAIANLQQCYLVGTVENYQDFLKISQQKLRQFYPDINLQYSFLNKTSMSIKTLDQVKASLVEKLGTQIVAELEELNQLDYELYKQAQKIMDANLSRVEIA